MITNGTDWIMDGLGLRLERLIPARSYRLQAAVLCKSDRCKLFHDRLEGQVSQIMSFVGNITKLLATYTGSTTSSTCCELWS
jgi:hypothetical protein